jgi:hypothetical protein
MPKGKLVTPKTYFVGATAVNFDELQRYLEDTDQTEFWDVMQMAASEGLSGGEILVSYYAKLCYSALTTKKNENISQVRNIHDNLIGTIKSGHGCYDIETEVLTADGWKFWPYVTMEDRLATRTYGGVLEYHRPVRLINFVHKGRMYQRSGQRDRLRRQPSVATQPDRAPHIPARRVGDPTDIQPDRLPGAE